MFLKKLRNRLLIGVILLLPFCCFADISQGIDNAESNNVQGLVVLQELGTGISGTMTSFELKFRRVSQSYQINYTNIIIQEFSNISDYNTGSNPNNWNSPTINVSTTGNTDIVDFSYTGGKTFYSDKYYRIRIWHGHGGLSSSQSYLKGANTDQYQDGACVGDSCGSLADIYFVLYGVLRESDGLCGSSDGIVSNTAPADNLCSSGTAGGVYPTATGWSWTCFPVGFGQISSCSATLGENPAEGLCGADYGQLLSDPPENLCTDGLLVIGSYNETPAKYIWQCTGTFSEITVNCYADKSIINYPTPTPLEDCNTLDFLPALVCEIKNMIASAFTPSSDAIDNLNQALYKIKNKAPFNYIYSFEIQIDNLSVVENKKMNICIMDNCGDITVFDLLAVKIKSALYFLFSIGFIFYLINYIKRFFL